MATYEYTGATQSPTIPSGEKINVTGTTSAIYPGRYNFTCSLPDGNTWDDGSTDPIDVFWTITPKTIQIPAQTTAQSYTGRSQNARLSPAISNANHIKKREGGTTTATNAGEYTVTVYLDQPTVPDTEIAKGASGICYVWPDGSTGDKVVRWRITGQAVNLQSIGDVHFVGSEWMYDDKYHSPTLVGAKDGTITYSGDVSKKAVGNYTITATPATNYAWSDGSTTAINWAWKITTAKIRKPQIRQTEMTFSGSSQGPVFENYTESSVEASGTLSAVEVGLYTISFTPNENCVWEDNTRDTIEYQWSITPAVIEEIPDIENIDTEIFDTYEQEDEILIKPKKNYRWADGTTTTKTIPREIENSYSRSYEADKNHATQTDVPIPTMPNDTTDFTASSRTSQSISSLEQARQNIVNDMKQTDGDLKRTLHANGVFYLEDMKFNDSFYRYPRNDPYNYVDGAREYLFFTKPDLPLVHDGNASGVDAFLTEPARNIPYFTDLAESPGYRKSVFANLSYSGMKRTDGCPFIRILSNRKTSNMDVPDINVEELETAVNMYGTKILYPKSSDADAEGVDFTIEFQDTRYCEIYHLFKVWDYYRSLKWYGVVSPASFLQEYGDRKSKTSIAEQVGKLTRNISISIKESTHSYSGAEGDYVNYLFYKVLHDHIRVFKFLIDNDGETILYAASAIGCYPKTIQRSTFSEIPEKGPLNLNIGFKISGWFEDNITNVVQDFNAIVGSWRTKEECYENEWPIYDPTIGFVSQELVDVPFIVKVSPVSSSEGNPGRNTEFARYLFKWARFDSTSSTNQNYSTDGTSSSWADFRLLEEAESEIEPLTNVRAPNGTMVTQNDWDYLANQDYDDDAIRTILFSSDKYRDTSATA